MSKGRFPGMEGIKIASRKVAEKKALKTNVTTLQYISLAEN